LVLGYKLKGPQKWTYYYLYVILDIFSRYVPGWMIAEIDKAFLAEQFIAETCEKQGIIEDQLIIHSDRGPSMKAKLVAELMADLGVTKSHSRPYNSNDNPYSEAQFKTVKYCPRFPERFGSIRDARSFSRSVMSIIKCRIKPMKFHPCIFGSELPVNLSGIVVSHVLPS
jgi:putative transposase